MKEIKFRFFNQIDKKMYYDDLGMSLDGGLIDLGTPMDFADARYWQGELMQYTGLKDKNGKEIYEGDIIGYKGLYPVQEKIEECVRVVEDINAFGCYPFNLHTGETFSGWDEYEISDIEVIGNIHENPELLEDKEDL